MPIGRAGPWGEPGGAVAQLQYLASVFKKIVFILLLADCERVAELMVTHNLNVTVLLA